MATFVYCESGAVNADHVARTEVAAPLDGRARTRLLDVHGKLLGIYPGTEWEFVERAAPVIGAAPKEAALLVWVPSEDERPTSDSVQVRSLQIIGWRVVGDDVQPVFPESPASNEAVVICAPDNTFLVCDDREFKNMEEVRAYYLAQAQAEWDDKNRK